MLWFSSYVIVFFLKNKGEKNRRHYLLTDPRINNERPTGQKQQLLDGRTVENKGKLILTLPILVKFRILR